MEDEQITMKRCVIVGGADISNFDRINSILLISSEERESLELTLLAIDDVDVEEFVE
jgi:hypothetical protein